MIELMPEPRTGGDPGARIAPDVLQEFANAHDTVLFADPLRMVIGGAIYEVPIAPFTVGLEASALKVDIAMLGLGVLTAQESGKTDSASLQKHGAAVRASIEQSREKLARAAELIYANVLPDRGRFRRWRWRRGWVRNPCLQWTPAELREGLDFLLLSQRIKRPQPAADGE